MLSWRRRFTTRKAREADMERELRAHLETEVEEQVEAGVDAEEARFAARRAFGNVPLIQEEVRAVWEWTGFEAFVRDIRFGVRLLGRSRAFAVFSILSLGLGIGAASAVFSLFDAIVLRHLPVPDPAQLVTLSFEMPGRSPNSNLPYPHFARMRDESRTLDGLFAYTPVPRIGVGFKGQVETASGVHVTGDYHQTLRLRPALGRLLISADDRPGSAAVAVLSHAYWQRRFGGNPAIVGAALLLNGVPFTVVGVEPRGFFGVTVGQAPDLTVPLRARDLLSEGKPPWDEVFATWIEVMGRLRRGASRPEAERELNLIFRRVNAEGARSETERRIAREAHLRVQGGQAGGSSGLRHGYERWLRLLLLMLTLVLVLASLNVATLLLARSEARRGEIATRLALGAGRVRIIRQLITESLIIGGLGCALGLILSWWGSRTLLRLAVPGLDRLPVDLGLDAGVVGFAMAVSSLSCLLFAVVPAMRATSSVGPPAAREVGGTRRRLADRSLVAVQVALSIVLLAFAGLFLRSLRNLWAQEAGYDRSDVLMFSVDARLAGKKGQEVPQTYRKLLDDLRTIPGARSVSVSAVRPVSDGYYFISVVSQVGTRTLPEDQPIRIAFNRVAPHYFATFGIPLLAGRDFEDRDQLEAPCVAIISERMAHHFASDPIGQRIALARKEVCEVVGVAKDTRYANVRDAPREVVYLPLFQQEPGGMWYSPTFEVRYAGSLPAVLASVRETVARAEPGLTLFGVKTLEVQTAESLSPEWLLAVLTTFFGGFALLLACIGLYGLLAYTVTQRTPELGLRMALGARPVGIRWAVLRESAATVLVGTALGLVGSLAAVRSIRSRLFGLSGVDPYALAIAASVLLVAAFAASYLPAFRASRIDPLVALRHE